MRAFRLPLALAAAVAFARLPAQTFIVDAANGPGTNFTTIAAAVAAVPDGSTLLVRPGVYGGFSISGKGLTLLGGAGVQLIAPASFLAPSVLIQNTQALQSNAMRGFTFSNFDVSVLVSNCQGPVLIEEVILGNTSSPLDPYSSPPATYSISGSAEVILRDCTSWQMTSGSSNLVLERCLITGPTGNCGRGTCANTYPGLTVSSGTTQIADCTINGSIGFPNSVIWWPPPDNKPAIQCNGGALRILAPSTLVGGSNPGPWPPAPAIAGSGSLRIDPSVVVQAAVSPAIAATMTTNTLVMPTVSGTSAGPGGVISGTALGPVGNLVILLVGLPGPSVTVLGITDPFWLDPAAYWFAAFGVPQSGVPVAAGIPVPSSPVFAGFRVGWQSVSASLGGLEASNPTVTLVR